MSATHPDIAGTARAAASVPLSRRDEATLAVCLEPLRISAWPDVAWRSSRLTRDGFPVEFAFCGHDAALRVTIEPAGPEIPEAGKLDCALDLLDAIGHRRPDRVLITEWRDMQAQARLRWGTWLGLRESANWFRTKLYIEVPPSTRLAHTVPAPLGGRLRMVGYEPETGRSEFYYALPTVDARQLSRALVRYGIESPPVALDFLAHLAGLPLTIALQWLGVGLSVVTSGDRRCPGVALFFRAAATHGGQGRIRDAVLQQQQVQGIRNSSYRSLFVEAEARALPDHGVVTLALSPDGGVEVRVGISGTALLNRWSACDDSARAA